MATARRVLFSIGHAEIDRVRRARALARERAWKAGAAPGRVILDFDATPISIHSEKEQAAGHYKGGFGFNPLLASCGREVLAGVLRPGNAGANNAEDHLDVLELALEQLPESTLDGEILARSDSAGASHAFASACRECRIHFSLGYAINQALREQILALDESAWRPAVNKDGQPRDGAWVAELTGEVNLDSWPSGTRLICRRERPHPGAQLSFTDLDGHRFQCFITDQPDPDIAALEALHRQHAEVEDRVKTLKACGAGHLPFQSFQANTAWFELALTAHDILVWTQQLLLDGEHAISEPKRLRYRILHVAGQITRHARRTTLHLPPTGPGPPRSSTRSSDWARSPPTADRPTRSPTEHHQAGAPRSTLPKNTSPATSTSAKPSPRTQHHRPATATSPISSKNHAHFTLMTNRG